MKQDVSISDPLRGGRDDNDAPTSFIANRRNLKSPLEMCVSLRNTVVRQGWKITGAKIQLQIFN